MNVYNSPVDKPNWEEINYRINNINEEELKEDGFYGVTKETLLKISQVLEKNWAMVRKIVREEGVMGVAHIRSIGDLPLAVEVQGNNIYVLGKKFINRGALKKVTLAVRLNDLMPAAHATIRFEDLEGTIKTAKDVEHDTIKEIGMHYRLNNEPEFVHLHHELVYTSKKKEGKPTVKKQSLMLEYCNGGDLFDAEELVDSNFKYIMDVVKHLFKGLKLLEEKNLIHRDIKPENLLLMETEEELVLKFGDLGFTNTIDDERKILLKPGTVAAHSKEYQAPEVFYGNALKREGRSLSPQELDMMCSSKTDVWSAGITLFVLLKGEMPNFAGKICYSFDPKVNEENQKLIDAHIDLLRDGNWIEGLEGHEDEAESLCALLYNMLTIDQEERVSGTILWEQYQELFEEETGSI